MAAEYNIEKENHGATRSLSETLTLQLEQGHANLATKTNELSEEKEKLAIAQNELVKEKENLVKLTDDLNEAREKNHDIVKQLDTEKALSNTENASVPQSLALLRPPGQWRQSTCHTTRCAVVGPIGHYRQHAATVPLGATQNRNKCPFIFVENG
mgnify:CR=1 FL=1